MNVVLNFLDTYDTSSKSYVECLSDCETLMTKPKSVSNNSMKQLILKTYSTFSFGDPLSNPLLDRYRSPLFALLCRNKDVHHDVLRFISKEEGFDAFDVLLDCIQRSPFQELVKDMYAVVKVLSEDISNSEDARTRLLELRDEVINQGKTEASSHISSFLNFYSKPCECPEYVVANDETMEDVIKRLRSEMFKKVEDMHSLTKEDEMIKSKMLVLTTDREIGQCLGPLNPKLVMTDYDEEDDYVCSIFGCRMLTCNCMANIDEDENDFEDDWFRGMCDRCQIHIESPSHATRIPLAQGCWRGCFCSTGTFDCVRQYVTECGIINGLDATTYMNPLSRVIDALNDTTLLEY